MSKTRGVVNALVLAVVRVVQVVIGLVLVIGLFSLPDSWPGMVGGLVVMAVLMWAAGDFRRLLGRVGRRGHG